MSDAKQIKSRQEFFIVANKDIDGQFYLLSGEPHVSKEAAVGAANKSISEINDWRNTANPPLDIPAQTRRIICCVVCEEINEELT